MWRKKSSYLLLIVILIGSGFPHIARARKSIPEAGQLALAPVDYLPPAMTAIDVEGNYAYVGAGPSLLVIDVSDPANPRRVGYEVLPDMVLRVMSTQGRVYVTSRNTSGDHLLIYDSSQPENLRLIADHDLSVLGWSGLAVEGSRIYATKANSMKILDATGPQHLVEITQYVNPDFESFGAIHAQNGILTIITRVINPDTKITTRYLLILDMTEPSNPIEVGKCELSPGVGFSDMDVTGEMAAIAVTSYDDLYDYSVVELIDLTDQAHPKAIATIDMGIGDSPEIALLGHLLVIGQRGEGASYYDISDPTTPELLDYLDEPCGVMIGYNGRLYGANGAAGMAIYTSPDEHTLTKQGSILGIGSAEDISLEDGIIAIADGGHHGYSYDWIYGGMAYAIVAPDQTLDIAGKFNSDNYMLGGGAYLALREHIVYLLAGNCSTRYNLCSQGLYVIDISQLQSPHNLGLYSFYREPYDNFSGPITIHDDYAYLPKATIDSLEDGIAIFDVNQMVTPWLVNVFQYSQDDHIYSLAITGTYGLISTIHDDQSSSNYNLRVLDFTNPISPTVMWSYPVGGHVQVILQEGLGFIAEQGYEGNSLFTFDTGQLPVVDIISDIYTDEQVLDVAYDGRYAYVASGETGLLIYDLVDPAAPRNVYTYDSPGTAKRVILDGEYVYLADGEGGLWVFRKTYLYPQAYLPLVPSQAQNLVNHTK